MCRNNKEEAFKKNCSNCSHSSLEIFEDDKVVCDKDNSFQKFEDEKDCYED